MSQHFAQRIITGARMPNKPLPTLSTVAPVADSLGAAQGIGHGTVGKDGKISFTLTAAKTVSAFVFCVIAKRFLLVGTVSAVQNGLHSIDAPEGFPYFLAVDATTADGWVYDEKFTGSSNYV